jgi:hypothetical protein
MICPADPLGVMGFERTAVGHPAPGHEPLYGQEANRIPACAILGAGSKNRRPIFQADEDEPLVRPTSVRPLVFSPRPVRRGEAKIRDPCRPPGSVAIWQRDPVFASQAQAGQAVQSAE